MHRRVKHRILSILLMFFVATTLLFAGGVKVANAQSSNYALSSYEKNLLQNLAFKGWKGFNVREADLIAEIQIRVAGWVNNANELMDIDGYMGPQTRRAIRNFNIAYGIGNTDRVIYSTAQMLNWLENNDGSTAHFKFSEFACKGNPYTWSVWYGTSPKQLSYGWSKLSPNAVKENIRRLMWRLEALRTKLGNNPIKLTSGFRYYTYNKKIGGANNSQHIYGKAADISVRNVSPEKVYKAARESSFGGLGLYNSFVHVDTRNYVARWK